MTANAHAAILDDGSVDRPVRVAVLSDLEDLVDASDRAALFEFFCEGEAIRGPRVGSVDTIAAGHAMTLDDFTILECDHVRGGSKP